MALNNYLKIDASVGTSVGSTTAAVQLPGTAVSTDTCLLITNVGALPVYFNLGTSNAVTVTNPNGTVVMGGQTLAVDIHPGLFTYIAMMTGVPGCTSTVNLTTGS